MIPTRALTITVSEGLYGRFVEMSRKQGMTPPTYAKLLFEAAYSARCGMTGDRELDAAVAAIGVERAAAPAETTEAETALLRSQLQEANKMLTERDATIAEWQAAKDEELRKARERVAEQHETAFKKLIVDLELLLSEARQENAERASLAARQAAKVTDLGLRLEEMDQQHAEARARCDELQEAIAARDAQISELEARIAAANMTQISDPEPATLAEAGGGMEETAAARSAEQPQAVSSANHALTPDQAKRARTYHGYGMSAAEIAEAMQVDAAIVEAVLGRAA